MRSDANSCWDSIAEWDAKSSYCDPADSLTSNFQFFTSYSSMNSFISSHCLLFCLPLPIGLSSPRSPLHSSVVFLQFFCWRIISLNFLLSVFLYVVVRWSAISSPHWVSWVAWPWGAKWQCWCKKDSKKIVSHSKRMANSCTLQVCFKSWNQCYAFWSFFL